MPSNKVLFLFVSMFLLTSAYMAGDFSVPIPSARPPEAPAKIQATLLSPTRTAHPTPFSLDVKAEPVPAWVTDFANPIFATIAYKRPNFQDDFSRYHGWFSVKSGIDGWTYAELQDGMLFLELPERTKDAYVFNPKMNRKNFVLTLDLRFYHDQPEDAVRFQFDQAAGQSIVLDLSNNRNWEFHWGGQGKQQSVSGIYQHFPPEHIPVTIIMKDAQCAVYLNDDPLVYSDACRESPTLHAKAWIATFHLLRDNTNAVIVNFDNLKLWDLDAILP